MNRSWPRRILTILALIAPAFGWAGSSATNSSSPIEFFVAPYGKDLWTGSRPGINSSKNDGPFATLPRALAAVRKARGGTTVPARIQLRGGNYFLAEPLVITPEDSELTLQAYGDEHPVISGGRILTGWKEQTLAGRRVWVARIAEAAGGKWFFRELFVNGVRAQRCRYPAKGYLGVEELPEKAKDWAHGHTSFRFKDGDLKNWATATNAEIIAMNRWAESRLPITDLDLKQRMVRFSRKTVFALDPGDLYYVENALEMLTQPGQWYLDRAAGTVYYLPGPGERLDRAQMIAPFLEQIVRFAGHPESGQTIDRVIVRGIGFAHAEWFFPDERHNKLDGSDFPPGPQTGAGGFGQGGVGVPGAVWAEGLRQSSFENCVFMRIGDYALELGRGCQSNHVSRCIMGDLGSGGLKIGDTVISDNPQEQNRANEVSDCHIYDGGKLFHSAIGLWIGQSSGNRIHHNLIHDFYYTGISLGWTWGYGRSAAFDNAIEFNHIHHIGVKSSGDGPILSDMGGIYTLGRQPGTIIRNNLWHDMAGFRYGGWGIYFDEGTSGIVAESNVVYNTTHGGWDMHYGETNVVRNNIFAFGKYWQLQYTQEEPHQSFFFQTNIVYFDTGLVLEPAWPQGKFTMDWNIYFDARPVAAFEKMPFAKWSLDQWKQLGHDQHSLFLNPQFIKPEQHDFRLAPGSPALRLGFRPIDLSQVGVRPVPAATKGTAPAKPVSPKGL